MKIYNQPVLNCKHAFGYLFISIIVAIFITYSTVTQDKLGLGFETAAQKNATKTESSWAYFTIQSNIIVCLWYFFGFVFLCLRANKIAYFWESPYIKGAMVLWILLTFGVFNFVLLPTTIIAAIKAHDPNYALLFNTFFSNSLLHITVPVIALVDFIKTKWIGYKEVKNKTLLLLTWYSYPLIYAIITIIIGQIIGIYPYFFFDPNSVGWFGVIGVIIGLMVIYGIVFAIVIKNVNNKIIKNNPICNKAT